MGFGDDDDQQADDDGDLGVAELGFADTGRGDASDEDLDECRACGEQMPEYYTGEGGGGRLCPDCDTATEFDAWDDEDPDPLELGQAGAVPLSVVFAVLVVLGVVGGYVLVLAQAVHR
jgi:hypothetical protein